MKIVKPLALTLVAGLALVALPICSTAPAHAKQSALKALDGDNDGTVDADEVGKAAAIAFDRLEKDKDSTLDRKELGSRISKKDFEAADPDNDSTLTKEEYDALVQKRFKAADADGDGTVDAKELQSKAGQALLRLVR